MSLPAPAPGTTVLVTGATSGIGAALARELAGRGYALTLVARRRERLEDVARDLGGDVRVHAADLADDAQRAALLDAVRADGREVVGLCNDAGVGSLGAFAELDLEHEVHIVRLNALAMHHLTGVFVRDMLARGSGAILNVASVLAFAPSPRTATYAATKAFVLSFSEALHAELLGTGVSCTALCPGPTRTAIFAASGEPRATGLGPDLLWQEPWEVARAGVQGMLAGRRTVVPGATNKLVAAGGRLVPRSLLLPVAGRLGGDRIVELVRGDEDG